MNANDLARDEPEPITPDADGRLMGDQDQLAKALVGKTIARADIDDVETALLFDDGTWCYSEGRQVDSFVFADWSAVAHPLTLLRLGLIDHAEMERRQDAERAERDEAQKAHDLRRLAELKAKYEGGDES